MAVKGEKNELMTGNISEAGQKKNLSKKRLLINEEDETAETDNLLSPAT